MENWTFEIARFAKVPFGVISSPFLLLATVRRHLESIGSPLAMEVKDNILVDNLFVGFDSSEEAFKAHKVLKEMFASCNMNLREFITNDLELNGSFPEADRLVTERPKILGLF